MATFALSIPHAGPRSFCLRPIRASSNGVPFLKPKSGGPTILEIPLDKIRRPLMRTRANDPLKIDVLEVEGVYYGFSGCHRYEAHQRLGLPTIRCKVRRGTKETLRHHMR
ncbi:sulfiredoxin, chloroplastic/mitochondrial-like isoform X2 [Zingiber officinale]|uniref:sulfiredoxin, chloroplastic/mitochondrial-like isoform X2 n=1 Tax=Zingiber officinale TaxID=94328 RepID=UPI001C4BB95A|nr:sulfiredoxin, chloroplastic/mitochondrial-like isoform X2 [Zingiber officinale]